MKAILYKLFSISLTLLVLLSTVSFTIEKHFCGDELIDVVMFSEVQKCATDNIVTETEMASVAKKNCCKDTVHFVKGQNELHVKTFNDLDFDQQAILSSFISSFINLFEGLPEQIIPHKDYSSPNLIADIHILDQVFII